MATHIHDHTTIAARSAPHKSEPPRRCPAVSKLRALTSADVNSLVRLFTEPDVHIYLGGPLPVAEARRRVELLLSNQEPWPHWAICSTDGNGPDFLGLVLLDPHHDGQDVQLSYLLLPEHQGRGCAFQAVNDALQHAFSVMHLARVIAETQSQNVRSIRLLERLGMTLERRIVRFDAEQFVYVCHPPRQMSVAEQHRT